MLHRSSKKEGVNMAYCTNCGKETFSKKVCEHCGVKRNKTHHFCEWCGNALDPKAKACPNCAEPKKSGTFIGKAISTFFAVLFIVAALVGIGESLVTGISFLLFGLLLLPVTKDFIRKITHNNMKLRKILKPARVMVLVVLFFVGGAALPESDTNYAEQHWNALTAMSEEEKEEEFREVVVPSGLAFEIIWSDSDVEFQNCTISTVEVDGDTYTAYGKVTVKDNYGDTFTGKFTAVYEFDTNTQEFDKVSVEIDTLYKN